MISSFKHEGFGISVHMGIILEELVSECECIIEQYKKLLPSKAKRENFPHFLWIAPPTHHNFSSNDNEKRRKFTDCLNSLIFSAKYYNTMSTL